MAAALFAALLIGCVSVTPPASTPPSAAPSTAEPSAAPTGAPSSAPTTAPTSSPTEAPTQPPTPAPTLGADVIFSDDFSGTTRYLSSGGQEGFGASEYAAGVFRVSAEPRAGYVNWQEGATRSGCTGTDCEFADVTHDEIDAAVVEVEATHVAGSTAAPFGISCSFQGTGSIGSFVGLTISADGRHYAVSHSYAPGDLPQSFLQGGALHGDVHPAIGTGSGVTNQLRAECDGQRFALFVNGELVASADFGERVTNPEFSHGVALIAAGGPDGASTVEFDNLVVSELTTDVTVAPQSGVVFEDPLTSDAGWWTTGDLGYMTAEFTGTALRVTIPEADTGGWLAPIGWVMPSDLSVSVDATFVDGPELSFAQLMCRNSARSFYRFGVGADGAFALQRVVGDEITPIVDWGTPSELANAGVGSTNSLRLDCSDEIITGLINAGVVLSEVDDSLDQGGTGVGAISTADAGGTVYDFANFVVSYPEGL